MAAAPDQRPAPAPVAAPPGAVAITTGAGIALTGLYAYATSRLALPDFFPSAGVSLDFIKMLGPSRFTPAFDYVLLAALVIPLYAAVLWVAWRHAGTLPRMLLVGFPLLFAAALLFMYPPTAVDLFHYHADARTLWLTGQNPLVVPPAHTGYPIGISWADQASPYGPAWQLLTALLAPLIWFGDHTIATLIGLKVFGAASLFGCAWLVFRLVRRTRPGWEWFAFVLVAWNPFFLMRAVANGHNDLAMMFFALFAIERAERRDFGAALPLLALSMLVKYTTALLVPPLLLYAWWQVGGKPVERARALAPGAGIAAAVVVIAFLPFWAGTATFNTVRDQATMFITSVPDVMRSLLWDRMGVPAATTFTLDATRLVFVVVAVPVTWRARRSFDHLLVACFTLLLLYLVVASAWFRPWYMLWPAVLLAMRPTKWGVALFLAITIGNLFPDLIEQYRYDWGLSQALVARTAPLVAQFVPVLVVWFAAWSRCGGWDLGARAVPAAADVASPPEVGADAGEAAPFTTTTPRAERSPDG